MLNVRKAIDSRSNQNMKARQTQFEALVHAYSTDLYRYALWLVRNSAQAEDLVQETFLRAWKSMDSLREPKAAKTWLITILRRERARMFERRRSETDSLDHANVDSFVAIDTGLGSTEHFALRRALATLTESYREPLLLQVIGGYSCDEIAEILDMQPGAVMTRLTRARQKMARILTGDSKTITREDAIA